jgi:hypothetical protein
VYVALTSGVIICWGKAVAGGVIIVWCLMSFLSHGGLTFNGCAHVTIGVPEKAPPSLPLAAADKQI